MKGKGKTNGWKVACLSILGLGVIGGAIGGGFAIADAVRDNQVQEEDEVQTPETPTDEENNKETVVDNAVLTNFNELCEQYM